jgi:hypothetical protein
VADESKIPPGAVISPPDSAVNSSDDEEAKSSPAGRQLENLAELQAAVRIIEQQRDSLSKPSGSSSDTNESPEQGLALIMLAEDLDKKPTVAHVEQPAAAPRRLGHSRSSTEPSAFLDLRAVDASVSPSTASDEDMSDEELSGPRKPPMLRKKSGELVRPALRPASARRRPSSMPGTPTFSKAVHFDAHLEHIRHFLQVDKPLAVSAGSSPVAMYDNETEFPFDESPPFEWSIVVTNFPADTPLRLAQPVRVERVFLSGDNKTLVGSVSVANLAFHKTVVARFTLDYWKTTSEVVAEYNHDVRQPKHADGRDRFNFNIKLADLANLEAKTMFFCVKYTVNGQDSWDNNNSTNFQVDFRKKDKPRNGKNGAIGAASRPISNQLPRSHARSSPPSSVGPSPKTIPGAFDDFGDGFDDKYRLPKLQLPVHTYLGESARPLRLKGAASGSELPSRRSPVAGQAFGNRYDFGASLNAARNATNTYPGAPPLKGGPKKHPSKMVADAEDTSSPTTLASSRSFTGPPGSDSTGPAAPSPLLTSQSYNELLDKYCFVR